jgi:hypothetical protein
MDRFSVTDMPEPEVTKFLVCMTEIQQKFMLLFGQPPARLTVEEVAWALGCQHHDVPVLIANKLLKPLGSPPPNGVKYFATADLLELSKDRSWLVKMTNAISMHWHHKNSRRNAKNVDSREVRPLPASAAN